MKFVKVLGIVVIVIAVLSGIAWQAWGKDIAKRCEGRHGLCGQACVLLSAHRRTQHGKLSG